LNPYAIPPLVSASLFGVAGLFVYSKNPKILTNRLFLWICLITVFWQGTWFVLFQFPHPERIIPLIKVGYTGITFIPIVLYHFAISFLHAERDKRFLGPTYLVGLFFGVTLHTSDLYIRGSYQYFFGFYPKAGLVLHPVYLLFLSVVLGRAFYLLFHAIREPSLPVERYRQRRLLLIAYSIYTMAAVDFLANYGVEFYPFGFVFILIALGVIGYAIVAYHLMDISTLFHKTAAWLAISAAVVVPVTGIFYEGRSWIQNLSPTAFPIFVALTGLLLIPYAKWVLPHIDQFFERRKYDLKAVFQDFTREISILKGTDQLIARLQETIASVLYPEKVSLILFDPRSEEMKPVQTFSLDEAFRVAEYRPFLKWLGENNGVVEQEKLALDPRYDPIRDAAGPYILAVDAKVIVPLAYNGRLVGVINLGPKKNLRPYTQDEIDFLVSLKIEGAIALSNSLLYSDVQGMSESLRKSANELEARVKNRTYELEESYEKLKELDRIKSRFFANISHELRTPLTLLMGPANLILSGQLGAITEKQEEHLKIIQLYSTRLLRLINNLLDLSKRDAGAATLLLERGNFVLFVRQIVNAGLPMAQAKGVALSFESDETVPEFLYDPGKMEDVLLNLLSNALKFTEKGEIRISCARQWNNVCVKIADTGCGIPREAHPKLFDRFFQVDTAISRGGGGTGIGLSLVKEWIELHGGQVGVESEVGKGTTFSFTIPMRLEEVGVTMGRAERRQSMRPPPISAIFDPPRAEKSEAWRRVPLRAGTERVLLVDDSPDMLHFLVDQLRGAYNISLAKNGEEGIAQARSEHPDLIISDIMMPIKDGYQLCLELKADPQTATIPIILLTARGSLSDKIEGLEQGADDYLTKPFNQEELRARVLSLLHKRRLQKEIETAHRVLEEKVEDLTRSNEGLSALKYAVSHTLRAPLRAIDGFAAILSNGRENPLNPEGRHCLDVIRENIDRMNQLIAGLTHFSQVGDQAMVAGTVDMEALARSAADALKSAEPARTLEITLHSLPPALGDRALLHHVWTNLLENAVKYTRSRTTARIEVWADAEGDQTRYCVRDNGVGFDNRFVGQLFKISQRLHAPEAFEGTGVGLALVQRIIHRHGGQVGAEGTINEGATFHFTLPKRS
jgi:signal transduction histidine kinase